MPNILGTGMYVHSTVLYSSYGRVLIEYPVKFKGYELSRYCSSSAFFSVVRFLTPHEPHFVQACHHHGKGTTTMPTNQQTNILHGDLFFLSFSTCTVAVIEYLSNPTQYRAHTQTHTSVVQDRSITNGAFVATYDY